ncbi:PGPGW domain-containing protein [Roseicella sp. DB1501]|uniref:PGPGW domain-containing protein n=1 Tax=Roseicella sp. DB1501 TaxID=2730925 RepID=UPI001C2C6A3F|nr:PGPGW domain-containing protein [Roseicella sp. DB1501]
MNGDGKRLPVEAGPPRGSPSLPRKLAGFGMLGLGLLGMVLPVLQGFLFLALGLFILRDQYDWARAGMTRLRMRFPRQIEGVEAMEARLVGWSRRQGERLRRLLP